MGWSNKKKMTLKQRCLRKIFSSCPRSDKRIEAREVDPVYRGGSIRRIRQDSDELSTQKRPEKSQKY